MNNPEIVKHLEKNELNATQAEEVAGGDSCPPEVLLNLTGSLTTAYENLVDFASHVIDRVAGNS
jgi:hypothetical protein